MKITEDMLKDIQSHDFILNKHDVMIDGEPKTHWDIRVPEASMEWMLVANPVDTHSVVGVEGKITNPRMVNQVGKVRIGSVDTEITRVDAGTVQIIDSTYVFKGDHLRGAWTTEQEPNISRAKIFSKIGD
jgi:hypothetical protein